MVPWYHQPHVLQRMLARERLLKRGRGCWNPHLSLCIPLSLALSLKYPWHWCFHWVSCSGTTLSQAIQISFTFSITLLYEEIEVGISFSYQRYYLIPSFTHTSNFYVCELNSHFWTDILLGFFGSNYSVYMMKHQNNYHVSYNTVGAQSSAGKILC